MLYPDFSELVGLGHKASRLQLLSGRRSVAAASGDYTSPFRGQGLAFLEVREYRPGDDIRTIDWRVTARTDRPHVKVFTEERERTVILCIDANSKMRFGTRGTFKSIQVARAAALLGWQANSNSDRVGCIVFGDVPDGMQFFIPTRSKQALWQALKLLCHKELGVHKTPVALESALKYLDRVAPTGSLLAIISDFNRVTETLEKFLGNVGRTCDIVLIAINDVVDRDMPAMQTVVFGDDAGHKLIFNSADTAVRSAYAKQWHENRKRLEEMAGRRNVALIDLHTHRDVRSDLLLGLRRLSIRRAMR